MTTGHSEAQALFETLGRQLGFDVARSYSRELPTDGVWYSTAIGESEAIPVVALEVVASEGRKTIRGSVLTLELVSPALGVVLIHDEEIRRRTIRLGRSPESAKRRVDVATQHAELLVTGSRQRIEVWDFQNLLEQYRQATRAESLWRMSSGPNEQSKAA